MQNDAFRLKEGCRSVSRLEYDTAKREYGGRYIVRGAEPDVVEGEPADYRIVIVEFGSMARAREWYASPSYAPALKIRQTALERRLTFVEGIPAP